MSQKLNLLDTFPKVIRNIESRKINKEKNRNVALKFGMEYIDGSRDQGYGGYVYDKRWIKVAKKIIKVFNLVDGSSFLDIGCAKGFLIYDLYKENQNLKLSGLDISEYAIENSPSDIRKFLKVCDCRMMNYPDDSIDCVVSINTLHNLELYECKNVISEIQRISNGRSFIQVDAYRNKKDYEIFVDWMLTAKTFLKPREWLNLFKEVGYTGFYNWTILKGDGDVL